jgi:hypothetical protein
MRNGCRSLRARARQDGGFTLPMVLLMVLTAFAVASAAVLASFSAQSGTTHDFESKDAFAAAEAGAHEGMLRYNATTVTTGNGDSWGQCLPSGTPVSDGAGWSWCPDQQAQLPDGSTYTYKVGFPQQVPGAPLPAHTAQIVSQGRTNGVTRRIDMTVRSASSQTPFSTAGIVGLNSIALGSNATLQGSSATNGDFSVSSNDTVCGNVQVGPGRNVIGGTLSCPGGSSTVTQGVTALPPVNEGNVAANNQNGNFFSVNPVSPAKTNALREVCFNGRNANGETDTSCGPRELSLNNGGTGVVLTLNGGNYSLCKLTLQSGTSIYVANGAQVTIYFDSPENCGYTSATQQLSMASHTSLQVNGGSAQNLRLLFVGSDTIPTSAIFASNTTGNPSCNQDFVMYGPRTDIILSANSYFCGALAGKTVTTQGSGNNQGNVTVSVSNLTAQYTLPGWVDHYAIDDFRECTGPMPTGTAPPSSGC